jgi:hypothetical protein
VQQFARKLRFLFTVVSNYIIFKTLREITKYRSETKRSDCTYAAAIPASGQYVEKMFFILGVKVGKSPE